MVVLDEYSRFPLVESLNSIKCQVVQSNVKLDILFSIFGIPDRIRGIDFQNTWVSSTD
jgi:hypothetical protein